MADDADNVTEMAEITAKSNLYESHRDEPQAIAIGECLYCGEAVEAGRRWCDAQCRDDWEAQ